MLMSTPPAPIKDLVGSNSKYYKLLTVKYYLNNNVYVFYDK